MYARTEQLIAELETRFGYTQDNTRDLIADPMFSIAEVQDELEIERSYRYVIAHLHRCDEGTDRACWGDLAGKTATIVLRERQAIALCNMLNELDFDPDAEAAAVAEVVRQVQGQVDFTHA